MKAPEELIKAAEEAERLAAVVSYAPDKKRLTTRAQELRRQAEALRRPPSKP